MAKAALRPSFAVMSCKSFPPHGAAMVIGSGGGLGRAFVDALEASGAFARVFAFNRRSAPPIDVTDEASITTAMQRVADAGLPLRLVIVATGILHGANFKPEKSWRDLDPIAISHVLTVNTIGPAIVAKHALPLLPSSGKAVFAAVSAKVGSISDNRLGGWHSYRASKAALNQILKTLSLELARKKPEAVCLALHPGTVDTALSAPFSKKGLPLQAPAESVAKLLSVIDQSTPADNGAFLSYDGDMLPW